MFCLWVVIYAKEVLVGSVETDVGENFLKVLIEVGKQSFLAVAIILVAATVVTELDDILSFLLHGFTFLLLLTPDALPSITESRVRTLRTIGVDELPKEVLLVARHVN